MEFEFDPLKSQANEAKHGLDFLEAERLWLDDMLLEIPARTVDEPRFLLIGMIDRTHWSAIVTYRNHRVRIISVRRSRKEEIELHERQDP